MNYFNDDFLSFLNDLEKNNNREWFNENKKRYEDNVKHPFELFVQDMIYKIQEDDDNLILSPKEAIFRIYRDIRFSNDKTPYKTHVSAVISPGGRKNYTDPGVYIEINSNRLRFYSGIYQLDKSQLENVRDYISSNIDEFKNLLENKVFKRTFGTIRGDTNKRIPAKYKNIESEQPLIANKQFYYFTEIDSNLVKSKNLSNKLMKFYFAAKPMNLFLRTALN